MLTQAFSSIMTLLASVLILFFVTVAIILIFTRLFGGFNQMFSAIGEWLKTFQNGTEYDFKRKYIPYKIKGTEEYNKQLIIPKVQEEKFPIVKYQPYVKKTYFFSLAELKFYDLLKEITKDKYLLFSKVRICDLIQLEYKNADYSDFNRIKSKHVDFLICNQNPITPKVVIELDDSSHNSPKRQERDKFVDEAFINAGIPIVHIKVRREYDENKIIDKIKEACEAKYIIR